MGGWKLDDVPWHLFDKSRVDSAVVPLVKAAAMVEYNSGDYVSYLTNVFADDPRFTRAVIGWGREEVQHGRALGRWAELADPKFVFDESFKRFTAGFRVPLALTRSVRGSRTGELIARCMVETGTSSYYSALADATDEPVLKEICQRIASDEFAHYALFHRHMNRYLKCERLAFWERVRIAVLRIAESEDDELGYAYYAANGDGSGYDRERNVRAYQQGAFPYYKPCHVARGVAMIFEAVGLDSNGWLGRRATDIVCFILRRRARRKAFGLSLSAERDVSRA